MADVKFPIRLYHVHDLDLISYLESYQFSLVKAVYSALTAYVHGEHFVIESPPPKEIQGKIKRVYYRVLSLDPERDREVIDLLYRITPGYRNNFMKNLLRLYLCAPLCPNFLENPGEMGEFCDSFGIFREGKKMAKAGRKNRVSRPGGKTSLPGEKEKKDPDGAVQPVKKAEKPASAPSHPQAEKKTENRGVHTPERPEPKALPDEEADNITQMFESLLQ